MNNESIQRYCLSHNFDFYEYNVNEIRRRIVPPELLRFIHIIKERELYSVIVYADTGKDNNLSPLTSFSYITIEQLPLTLMQALRVLHSRIKNLSYHSIMVSEHIKHTEKNGTPVLLCSILMPLQNTTKYTSVAISLRARNFSEVLNEIASMRDEIMERYNVTPLESLSIQDKTYLLQSLRNIINN